MKKRLRTAFHAAFGVLVLTLLAVCAASWSHNAAAALAAAAILGSILWLAWRQLAPAADAMPVQRFRLLFSVLATLWLALLCIAGNLLRETLISDMGVVYDTLPEFLAHGHPVENNDYYIICNNNLGLALLLYGFYTAIGLFGITPDLDAGLTAGICLNCAAIFAAGLLVCLTAYLLSGRQSPPLLVLVLCMTFVPFYLWAPYFYSDTLCMPFLGAVLALYAACRRRPRLWLTAALGTVAFLGFAVKGSLAVVPVAAVIALLLERERPDNRHVWPAALACVLSFACLWAGYRLFQQKYLDWTNKEAVAYPTELWLCYGSHGDGDYCQADADLCDTLPTLAARQTAMRKALAQNYSSRSMVQTVAFEFRKAARTWGDGLYGAEDYNAEPYRTTPLLFFTLRGQGGHMPLVYWAQAWQYLLLALCGIGSLLAVRRGDGGFFARLCLFGVMLFLSLWETKARYALHFAPVLLLCASLTLDRLVRAPAEKTKQKETAHV